jgi:hypothetical protein
MKAKDIVVVTMATAEISVGKVLLVKEVLGSDSFDSWYLLTDGARDYIVYGKNITLSVDYNASEA